MEEATAAAVHHMVAEDTVAATVLHEEEVIEVDTVVAVVALVTVLTR